MLIVNLANYAVSTTDQPIDHVAVHNGVLYGSRGDQLFSFSNPSTTWTAITGKLSLNEGRLSNVFQVVTEHTGVSGVEATLTYHTETEDVEHGPLEAVLSDRRFKASRKLLADLVSVTIQGTNIQELKQVALYTNPHPRRR